MYTARLERPTWAAVAPLGAVAWRLACVVAVATSTHPTPALAENFDPRLADASAAVWIDVVGESIGSRPLNGNTGETEPSQDDAAGRPAGPAADSVGGPLPLINVPYLADSWDREAEQIAAVSGNRGRHAALPASANGALSGGEVVVLFATVGGLLSVIALLTSIMLQIRTELGPAPIVGQRRGTA